MNGLPAANLSARNVAAAPELLSFPGAAPTEEETGGFGELLAEASGETTEETDETDSSAKPAPEAQEKEEDPVLIAGPLVFYGPPSEIKTLVMAETGVSEEPVELLEAASESSVAICKAPGSAETKTRRSELETMVEAVRPEREKAVEGAEKAKPAASKNNSLKSSEGLVVVDPEGVDSPEPEGLKGPEVRTHGTVVAQQANAMNNGQKSAEIAPAIEQKMPVGDQPRRILSEQARFEVAGFIADNLARAESELSMEPPVREISVGSLDSVELVETIRTEVTNLRLRGDSTVSVILRPDSGTELKIEVTIARDGTIHASARCERGDYQTLNAQWPQLQQSLAAHGVRVNELSASSGSQNQHQDSASAQNFDRGANSQNRQQQPRADFEEELAASAPRLATNNTFKNAATPPMRRWQTWA